MRAVGLARMDPASDNDVPLLRILFGVVRNGKEGNLESCERSPQ